METSHTVLMGYEGESSGGPPGPGLGAKAERTPEPGTWYPVPQYEVRLRNSIARDFAGREAATLAEAAAVLRTGVPGTQYQVLWLAQARLFNVPIPYTIGTPTKKMCPTSISKYAAVNAGNFCVIVGITASDITSQIIGPRTAATFSTP